MKFETVLNATVISSQHRCFAKNRLRKFHNFRAWLLRHDAQQRAEIERLKAENKELRLTLRRTMMELEEGEK